MRISEDVPVAVMKSLQSLLKKQNKSRDELADYLGKRLGRQVRRTTIEMWFAESKPNKWPPFPILLIMCDFVGAYEPFQIMAESRGLAVMKPEDLLVLEVGRAYLSINEKVARAVEDLTSGSELKF